MNEIKEYTEKLFEDIKHVDVNGNEYWLARELMVVLEYKRWDKFCNVIENAKISCKKSKYMTENHFSQVGRMVEIGSKASRKIYDIISIGSDNMFFKIKNKQNEKKYNFEYVDEIDFKRCERNLKKYNMFAYKKLIFEYYPTLLEGNFLGDLLTYEKETNEKSYELILPTLPDFKRCFSEFKLFYKVNKTKRIILLEKIEPYDVLNMNYDKFMELYEKRKFETLTAEEKLKKELIDFVKKNNIKHK